MMIRKVVRISERKINLGTPVDFHNPIAEQVDIPKHELERLRVMLDGCSEQEVSDALMRYVDGLP